MRKIIGLIVGMVLLSGVAQAGLLDDVKKIPSMKQGVAYSIADQKFNFLSTIELFEYKGFALEAGYAGREENSGDKAVAVLSYDVLNLQKLGVKTPILDLIDFRAGVYAGYGRIQLGTVPAMRGGNELDYGVSLTAISVKF